MDSQCLDIRDCKVRVRSYVLSQQSSRWHRKGERTIIHSPVLDISTASQIPAKRYNRSGEQNAVCFMKPSEIEKDTSIIYEKLGVSQSPSWVNAHGVALCESPSSNGLTYSRGDRFWINIGPNTNGLESSVPVINLRTSESGLVAVELVCWFPHLQDTNENIYTLGGDVRSLKLPGSRNYSYWSWAICQRLDTLQCDNTNIQVPTQEAKLDGCRLLAPEESQLLFEKKCREIEERLRSQIENTPVWLTPPPTSPAQRALSAPRVKRTRYDRERRAPTVPTPPSTPPTPSEQNQDAERKTAPYDGGCQTVSASLTPPQTPLEVRSRLPEPQLNQSQRCRGGKELWRRIFKSVQTEPDTPTAQSTSDPVLSEDSSTTSSSSEDSSDTESDDDTSPFSDDESLRSPGEQQQEADGLEAAGILCGLGREEQSVGAARTKYFDPQQEFHLDPVVPQRYAKNCNLDDASCVYNFLSTCKHYHVPPCIIEASDSEPSTTTHEHCISRLHPYPGQAGPCMLFDRPSRKHTCCRWKDEDMVGWPQDMVENYEQGRIKEDKRNRFEVRDRSRWIHRNEQLLHHVLPIFKDHGFQALETALDSGDYDAEVKAMKLSLQIEHEDGRSLADFLPS